MSIAKLKSLEHLETSPMMKVPPGDLEFTKNVYKKLPIIKSNLKIKVRGGMSNDTSIIRLSNHVSTLSFDKG